METFWLPRVIDRQNTRLFIFASHHMESISALSISNEYSHILNVMNRIQIRIKPLQAILNEQHHSHESNKKMPLKQYNQIVT